MRWGGRPGWGRGGAQAAGGGIIPKSKSCRRVGQVFPRGAVYWGGLFLNLEENGGYRIWGSSRGEIVGARKGSQGGPEEGFPEYRRCKELRGGQWKERGRVEGLLQRGGEARGSPELQRSGRSRGVEVHPTVGRSGGSGRWRRADHWGRWA